MIYVAHFPTFYTDWDPWRVVRNFMCEWIPCKLCLKVVVLCRGSRYMYLVRKMVDASRLLLIPNPISLDAIPTETDIRSLRAENGWDDHCCHVVCLTRLAAQKQVDNLLRSWAIVKSECASARLWIVGDGEERQQLEALCAELGIGETCRFLGYRRNGPAYLAAADIAAVPSLFEAHGRVPLEAMSCGRPVVANDVHGIEDSMTDGKEGFLAPPGDIELFAKRLLELIRDPGLRSQMADHGKQTVTRYDMNSIMPRYHALIESVLALP